MEDRSRIFELPQGINVAKTFEDAGLDLEICRANDEGGEVCKKIDEDWLTEIYAIVDLLTIN